MEPRVLKVLKVLKFDSGKAAEGSGIALSGDGGFKCRLAAYNTLSAPARSATRTRSAGGCPMVA